VGKYLKMVSLKEFGPISGKIFENGEPERMWLNKWENI